MTLLITIFAAIISTIVWYAKIPGDKWNIKMLCFLYWGASLMWFVDFIFEYVEMGTSYFEEISTEIVSDAFLGFVIVAAGLVIWLVALLIKDPKGTLKKELFKAD